MKKFTITLEMLKAANTEKINSNSIALINLVLKYKDNHILFDKEIIPFLEENESFKDLVFRFPILDENLNYLLKEIINYYYTKNSSSNFFRELIEKVGKSPEIFTHIVNLYTTEKKLQEQN